MILLVFFSSGVCKMKVFDCAKEVKIKLPLILLVQTSDTFEFNLPAFLHSDRTEESFFGGVGTGGAREQDDRKILLQSLMKRNS